jgi:hypothetical protein
MILLSIPVFLSRISLHRTNALPIFTDSIMMPPTVDTTNTIRNTQPYSSRAAMEKEVTDNVRDFYQPPRSATE